MFTMSHSSRAQVLTNTPVVMACIFVAKGLCMRFGVLSGV